MKKLFVIQKYVIATSIEEAMVLERKIVADECWLDDEWKKANKPVIEKGKLGFKSE